MERSGHWLSSALGSVGARCRQSLAPVQLSFERWTPLPDVATSTPSLRARYPDGPRYSEADSPTRPHRYKRPTGALLRCPQFKSSFERLLHSITHFPVRQPRTTRPLRPIPLFVLPQTLPTRSWELPTQLLIPHFHNLQPHFVETISSCRKGDLLLRLSPRKSSNNIRTFESSLKGWLFVRSDTTGCFRG